MQSLYSRIRANGATALKAYIQAKERTAAGKEWYNIPVLRPVIQYNPASDDGLRWVEHASAGLRFKGYADEVATRINHKGWYTQDDGFSDETLRGVVYQLPARDGKPQYIPGYVETCNFDDTGGARLDFSDIRDCEIEAAYAGDRLAEIAAEKEREHNSAWRAGNDYAHAKDTIAKERKKCLALLSAMRAERKRGAPEPICNALREQIKRHVAVITQARNEAAQLVDNFNASWRADVWPAFNEGAGKQVLS